MYSTANTEIKKLCLTNGLHLLDASVRHLGTDINYVVLENLYQELKEKVDFYFESPVQTVEKSDNGYIVHVKDESFYCDKCIISAGRSGSKWMEGSVHSLKFRQNLTAWTSVCAWNFRQRFCTSDR